MSSEFKDYLILKKEEFDLSWEDVHRLLGIPLDTLKKLKGQKSNDRNSDDENNNGA
ncbi:MAG: hypothetical protein K1X29_01665 [Bdellovibrionales bacterium]|nr:hypothetical protein [Bdellovibrionales bacterium]